MRTITDRNRLAGIGIAAAGLLLVVSGHLWADVIDYLSPSLAYAQFYARIAAPIIVVGALVTMGWMRVPLAAVLVLFSAAVTVYVMERLDASGQGNDIVLTIPWILALAVIGVADEDARDRSTDPARSRLYATISAGIPIDLTRFSANCCAADAIPFTVRVNTPKGSGAYGQDQWVQVTGTLVESKGAWSVQAEQLAEIAPPNDPYAY